MNNDNKPLLILDDSYCETSLDGFLQSLGGDVFSEADLAIAMNLAEQHGDNILAILSRLGVVGDEEMAVLLAEYCGYPLCRRSDFPEELADMAGLSLSWLVERAILPLYWSDDGCAIAMANPFDKAALEVLAFSIGHGLQIRVAPRCDILEYLAPYDEAAHGEAEQDGILSLGDAERFADHGSDAPAIKLIDQILNRAVRQKASDIHIEPMSRAVIIRLRIDGALQEVMRLPIGLSAALASRIKILSSLDIAETRLPQDGRLRFTSAGRDIDVRVSTAPAIFGETVVMRLLGRSDVALQLDQLGLSDNVLDIIMHALARPNGIIFVTGPTGSGKTTTLYAALNHLRRPDVKILSVEDPVEILLEGVNQVQVKPEINLDYAHILRSFLRQDPDILMVGEIRDRETADIAIRAALTGHLVLSTLHTNSALGAFTRLSDIGIDPYLIASTTIASIAQRLVRKLCPHCKVKQPVPDDIREKCLAARIAPPTMLYTNKGCGECHGHGYSGRMPIMEVIVMDDVLRQAINAGDAENYPLPAGTRLYDSGLAILARGETSLSELTRVAGGI